MKFQQELNSIFSDLKNLFSYIHYYEYYTNYISEEWECMKVIHFHLKINPMIEKYFAREQLIIDGEKKIHYIVIPAVPKMVRSIRVLVEFYEVEQKHFQILIYFFNFFLKQKIFGISESKPHFATIHQTLDKIRKDYLESKHKKEVERTDEEVFQNCSLKNTNKRGDFLLRIYPDVNSYVRYLINVKSKTNSLKKDHTTKINVQSSVRQYSNDLFQMLEYFSSSHSKISFFFLFIL